MFKDLTPAQERVFRAWARAFYTPGSDISELWHPILREECALMNEEHAT
jgi:hypothetical protein